MKKIYLSFCNSPKKNVPSVFIFSEPCTRDPVEIAMSKYFDELWIKMMEIVKKKKHFILLGGENKTIGITCSSRFYWRLRCVWAGGRLSRDSQCWPLIHNNKKYFNFHTERADEMTFHQQKHMKSYSRVRIVPSVQNTANLIGEQIDWEFWVTGKQLRNIWEEY
jgi:hypothetical protein